MAACPVIGPGPFWVIQYQMPVFHAISAFNNAGFSPHADSLMGYVGDPWITLTIAARELGVTREHLSRTFAADGAPNLKRIIDLVRLLAAAELAKNPGYDIRDVAQVLDDIDPEQARPPVEQVTNPVAEHVAGS